MPEKENTVNEVQLMGQWFIRKDTRVKFSHKTLFYHNYNYDIIMSVLANGNNS